MNEALEFMLNDILVKAEEIMKTHLKKLWNVADIISLTGAKWGFRFKYTGDFSTEERFLPQCINMAPRAGFEPATYPLGWDCAIHLCHRGSFFKVYPTLGLG
jgi:hypothetical protein